jgi:hypothetical protein
MVKVFKRSTAKKIADDKNNSNEEEIAKEVLKINNTIVQAAKQGLYKAIFKVDALESEIFNKAITYFIKQGYGFNRCVLYDKEYIVLTW